MNTHQRVWQFLDDIERQMQALSLWQLYPPEPESFSSQEPFFLDSMTPEQWLQWVFIPRMRALIENNYPLPEKLALTPYFEEALSERHQPLLSVLQMLDNLFDKEAC